MAEYYAKRLAILSTVEIYHAHHSAQMEDLTVWKVEPNMITWSRGHRHISAVYVASRWEIHQISMPKLPSSNLFSPHGGSSWGEKSSIEFNSRLPESKMMYRATTLPSMVDMCASPDCSSSSSPSSGLVSIDENPQWYALLDTGGTPLPEQTSIGQRKRLRSSC